MTPELGHARMATSRTVHVVREVAGGDGGPRLAALCGQAIGPLRDWSNYTWAAGAVPCSECEHEAARRTRRDAFLDAVRPQRAEGP